MREHYAHCEAEVRDGDKDRFLATLFAPAEARPHLFALYAFALEISRVAERVRDPLAGEIRLQWWRDALQAGGAAGHPVAAALLDTIERRGLSLAPLLALVDAHTSDLYAEPMPNLAALDAYADTTAGALFRLAAEILDDRDAALTQANIHAGRAQTYIWVLRNLARHAAAGKTYLPLELFERRGVRYLDGLVGHADREFRLAFSDAVELATLEYEKARALLGDRPAPSIALLPLAVVPLYLRRMTRAGYDPLRSAPDVAQWRRQWALWRAARRGL
jgi:phytoene synthase